VPIQLNIIKQKEKRKGAYKVSVGRPEGKSPLGRPRPRRENNIKNDLQEVRCGDKDCIDLAQSRAGDRLLCRRL